ncbi:hypothetical protein I4F81_001143 [Pyropia yezoensis]|uniref:Uncharacterized protein n=1 Tax=Pyropia yezoensis TaxID=2788 RepID=A0ACC3BKU8_PYRYE|nr:hypothetical protein I4F81_001143 [Neopyropia yezoensis]
MASALSAPAWSAMRAATVAAAARGAARSPAATAAAVATASQPRRLMSSEALKRTVLHDFHESLGGKMVPFAGYSMPVQYSSEGIKASHLWVRSSAGLFDVSHMGQVRLRGKDAVSWLEGLVVADVAGLAPGTGTLSVLTTESGGIIDDTIISNLGDATIGMVINAGCKDKDLAHMQEHLSAARAAGKDVDIEVLDDAALLALQGPKAAAVLAELAPSLNLSTMAFMASETADVVGIPCHVTRCGYTGEDGFELSVDNSQAVTLTETLLANEAVHAAGLGARDSLRLEAGLCLVIMKQLADGITRRRMTFVVEKGAPPRGHEKILNEAGEEVGEVTSGGWGPSAGKALGMGYAKKPFNKTGTKLTIPLRGKEVAIQVVKSPVVKTSYFSLTG